MRDTMAFMLKVTGADPDEFSDDEWQNAIDRLQKVVDSGQIRAFTGNEYTQDLAAGNILACEAWSGDVIQLQFDNPDIKFVTPEEGLSLWADNMMVPTLDTDIVGGATEEGTNYGLSATIYMTEMFALLKTCAGQNYIDQRSCFADMGYYNLYSTQPGITNLVNLGDQPTPGVEGRALVKDRNRLLSLHVADALPSNPITPYLQYWLNHKMTAMVEGDYEALDFLLYRDTRPESNITGLPLQYVASGTGFWNSRDSFADTGVSVSMSACSHGEEHHHSDFGALQIYRGDSPNPGDNGWLLIDINLKSTVGNNWDLVAHSADTFATTGNTAGWPQQYFGTPPVIPPPPTGAPTPPALTTPADGALALALPSTFTWTTSSTATSYYIEVATDLSFGNPVFAQTVFTNSVSVSGLAANSVHYWHVSASNSTGTSAFSASFSFTTDSGGITPPPPSGVKLVEDTSGMQIFPTNNWWNMDVSAWPVDSGSASYISVLNAIVSAGNPAGAFHPDWGTVTTTFGIPYIGVDSTQPLVNVVLGAYASESDTGQPGQPPGAPIPTQAHGGAGIVTPGWREENGDNHMLVFDRQRNYLYELYQATWNGSTWGATQMSCFQMNTNNRRPEGWTSCDAAGLAIFPGLVKYDDVHGAGPIRHATRFACKSANGYVYPGSHVGSVSTTPNHHVAGFLPFGARIRLKAAFDIASFVNGFGSMSASNKTALTKLLQSWKTYGLLFADTGSNGFVQGTMDNRWVPGEFNQAFHALRFSNFEVLELGKVGP